MGDDLKTIKSFVEDLNLTICPGHGDFHVKNMLFNEKTGKISNTSG